MKTNLLARILYSCLRSLHDSKSNLVLARLVSQLPFRGFPDLGPIVVASFQLEWRRSQEF